MKQCDRCGNSLKDEAVICPDCGVPCSTKTGNSLRISDVGNCVAGENTVKNIEQQVANYYNNTYLGAKPGKYVVLHHETTVSGNECNVVVRYQDGRESGGNITYIPVADVAVNMITGDCSVRSKPVKRNVPRTAAHRFISVVAIFVLLNIVFIPFLSDKDGLIKDRGERVHAYSFADMIEDMDEDYHSDDVIPIDILYYIACPMCVLCVFIGALAKSRSACTVGLLGGIALLACIFYQVYLGTTRWYIALQDAHLTFGYYLSCIGFLSMLMALLFKNQE